MDSEATTAAPTPVVAKAESYRYEEAVDDFSKAIELKPDNAELHFNRGKACKEMGRHEEAVDDFSRAIELKPDDAEFYFNRGECYKELDRHEEAEEDFAKAEELKGKQKP